MIETKQLQYLVVCAQLQSFSRAAEALYTTQPNVSKVIRTLEEELGFSLFVRQNRGIRLTERGRRVYEYAARAMENVEQLAAFSRMDRGGELLASWNPSSWMASCFAAFYQEHRDEDVCYHVMTASTEEILERCACGRDDLGFVYMMEEQMPSFLYRLERNSLKFTELARTEAYLYFGKDNPLGGKAGLEELETERVRLVQCYEDEFTLDRARLLTGETPGRTPGDRMKVSVVTNSDYVMNELLQRTELGNISGGYLSRHEESRGYPGYSLYGEERPVLFGCVARAEEPPEGWAEHFLQFVRARLLQ
ncbi:MAG: LysR family transcriptional regulator [Eubacteriales bacterium]|nr:LysR family transcriptional regulator [Eubacteriales bacterium]